MKALIANPRVRLLLGAALISFSPVYVAMVTIPATTSAFYRVAIGGSVLLAWLLITRKLRRFSSPMMIMLMLCAVAFALDLWFWHRSINYIGPGLSTLLGNFQVFFMTAAGALFLAQRPTAQQLIAIPIAVFGLALIVGFDWRELPGDYRLGVIYGLLTALSYAAYILAFRQTQTLQGESAGIPTQELAIISLATAALLWLTSLVEGQSLAIGGRDLAWMTAYALFAHVLGWLFIASSLARVPAALVGLSLLLQPLLSFIWDILFFARPISTREVIGAALALAAIYFGARQPKRPRPQL